MDGPLLLAVLTGLRGSGKTTFPRRVFAGPAMRDAAVRISGLGEIGLDYLLVAACPATNGGGAAAFPRLPGRLARLADTLAGNRPNPWFVPALEERFSQSGWGAAGSVLTGVLAEPRDG